MRGIVRFGLTVVALAALSGLVVSQCSDNDEDFTAGRGILFIDNSAGLYQLCDSLLESSPPQCGDRTVLFGQDQFLVVDLNEVELVRDGPIEYSKSEVVATISPDETTLTFTPVES